jgi:hypothetical protein
MIASEIVRLFNGEHMLERVVRGENFTDFLATTIASGQSHHINRVNSD